MQIDRDELCRIIEGSAPIRDELTGIPLGTQVETLADKIIAALSARPDSDMVERVAKALYEEDDPWSNAWPWPNLQTDQGDPEAYRRLARAAIAAMGSADMGGEG